MLNTTKKMDDELSLRRQAAEGNFQQVQEILDRHRINPYFNINAQSSNGNTALHWACLNAKALHKGFSKKFSETIRLLIENAADHLVKNKLGKVPYDFLQGLHTEIMGSEKLSPEKLRENSCYFSLVYSLLKKECTKITTPEELTDELAIEFTFYFIIDSLKLVDFFPSAVSQQETISVLSLGCGLATEILPLIMYFKYHNIKLDYIGIDNNEKIIEENVQRYSAFENVKFIYADAANLDEILTHIAPESIDMGILRNADFTELRNRQKIFGNIIDTIFPSVMKPSFPLLVSFQTKVELEICAQKTQILQNFKKFQSNNFCDVGSLCRIFGEYQNEKVSANSDTLTAILNFDKCKNEEELQATQFSRLSI